MKLSVVIPARNEAGAIESTLRQAAHHLGSHSIDYEILVVDDGSSDGTPDVVARTAGRCERLRCITSPYPNGFGYTVRAGLEAFTGDAVAIMMADGSDDPADLVRYYRVLDAGYDCAFGSRFVDGATVTDYPWLKLAINRVANLGISILFKHGYNDTTNAFKAYRREVIEQSAPLLSPHFNLSVELPLKAIGRGFTYAIVPISWRGRTTGKSNLVLREMGSRYLYVVVYMLLERHLSLSGSTATAGSARDAAAKETGDDERRV